MANATDVLGGTFTPHCAAINPALLVRSLARTVVALGAKLYEDTAATAIEPGIVRTSRGSVRAEVIVRAREVDEEIDAFQEARDRRAIGEIARVDLDRGARRPRPCP